MNELISALVAMLTEGGANAPGTPETRKVIEQIVAEGPEAVKVIVGLLKPDAEGGDAKARLALHNVALAVAAKDDAQRKAFAETMAAMLIKDRPADVQGFIIRQIQLCGGEEVVKALGERVLDADLGEPACAALVAIKVGAAAQFSPALEKANPRQRLVILQSLATLGDASAAPAFRAALASDDRDVRLTAAWGLARLGAADDAATLVALARREEGAAKAKAIDACFILVEQLGKSSKAAERSRLLTELRSVGEGTHVADTADRLLQRP
jgi:HEAT repeat protein